MFSIGNNFQTPPISQPSIFQFNQKYALLTVGVALTAILGLGYHYFSKNPCSPFDDLNLFQNNPFSDQIDSCNNITTQTEIKGTSITAINSFVEDLNLFGGRTLQEKMEQDCQVIKILGTTTSEIADHLRAIYDRAKTLKYTGSLHGKREEAYFSYDPAAQNESTMGKCSGKRWYRTPIFYPVGAIEIPKEFNIFNETITSHDKMIVSSYYGSQNFQISARQIELISEYGYFDGTSPLELASLITGHSHETLATITKTPTELTNKPLLDQQSHNASTSPLDLLIDIV